MATYDNKSYRSAIDRDYYALKRNFYVNKSLYCECRKCGGNIGMNLFNYNPKSHKIGRHKVTGGIEYISKYCDTCYFTYENRWIV